MKTKIILSLLVMIMAVSSSYASFPVTRTAATNTTTTVAVDTEDNTVLTSPAAAAADDTFVIALLLWFFLGGLAGHRWYLGSPIGWNILFILTLGGLGIWWIIDGIDILTKRYPGL
ncbi:MAG: S-adenosyl-L-homocysteine hydrolase [Alteromonas sp.]|nr:S-adenosyl-L-homocysteine hydrolase [Alteromonas sp.]MAY22632.1 S-adenosyl-L-homocysteine hydrolase [Flavobacteriaceae bacterium]|tara:strand:+ start:274 stop:621 length:348 start_codon:yes stop_codon:yes gene_type:complete